MLKLFRWLWKKLQVEDALVVGVVGMEFQPASKTKALTAYSTSSSHSIIPFDEMEMMMMDP